MLRGHRRSVVLVTASACLLLAWALRLYRLDAQSLWYDEAVSAQLAARPVWEMVLWTAGDIQPPLYYVLLHVWRWGFGSSEWALRSLSAWWGTLAIPLLVVLTWRLSGRWTAGVAAGLLFAVAPWAVYYSQEARMYAQLIALALLWVYATLRLSPRPPWRWVGAVAVGGLALLYTHYFALFLIGTWALWHGLLGQRSRPLVLRLWGAALGFMALGYAAWLPFVWRRFQEDASYWSGRLKLGEALRHWFVHMTLGAPETFLEGDAVRWLPLFGALTLLALVGLGRDWARRGVAGKHVAGVLVWLALPALAIFVVAYRTPKFNPRYVMLVYPAWLILVAWGYERLGRLVGAVGLGCLLFMFLWADWAWFTDPAFTKPDFRGAVAYVKAHQRPNDAVILVSGHMSPAIAYYAPDWRPVRLPAIDVLDVRAVLGFEVAPTINRALAGAENAWLILWQDNVVDPMGVVPYLLSFAGQETALSRDFWHVRVRHYRLTTGRVPEAPPIERRLDVRWDNRVTLIGLTQEPNGRVRLFFRAEQPLKEDYRLHMELFDAEGNFWGAQDVRPGPYMYPTFRWRPQQVVMGVHPLPAAPGTPAGKYVLRLRLYSSAAPDGLEIRDAQGAPQGRDVVVAGVWLPQTLPAAAETPWPPLTGEPEERSLTEEKAAAVQPVAVRWTPRPPWEPGQRVITQVRWQSGRPPTAADVVRFGLTWDGGAAAVASFPLSQAPRGDAASWPEGAFFYSQVRWRVPRSVPEGPAQFWVEVSSNGKVQRYALPVTFRASTRVFAVPPVQYPVDAVFGDAIRLVGLDVSREGETQVAVTVTWQALTEVDRSYTAFVHLLDEEGRVVAQDDHVPRPYPTDAWIAGEVVQDVFRFTVPQEVLGSMWVLELGFYDAQAPGMPRLPVTQGEGKTAVRVEVQRP